MPQLARLELSGSFSLDICPVGKWRKTHPHTKVIDLSNQSQTSSRPKMKRKSGIHTSEDMREDLECPVCLKIPRSTPIYQCDKGHIHCKSCHPRLRKCPICRAAIGDTRSLMTEKVIARLATKCTYHENGCNVPEDLPPEMTLHEKGCYYRTVKCIVKNCKDTFVVAEVLKHFASKHPELEPKPSTHSNMTKFSKFVEPPNKNSTWPPLILQANGRQFMVTRRQDTSGYFAMRVYFFGSSEEVDDYSCTIKAQNKSNVSKTLWGKIE